MWCHQIATRDATICWHKAPPNCDMWHHYIEKHDVWQRWGFKSCTLKAKPMRTSGFWFFLGWGFIFFWWKWLASSPFPIKQRFKTDVFVKTMRTSFFFFLLFWGGVRIHLFFGENDMQVLHCQLSNVFETWCFVHMYIYTMCKKRFYLSNESLTRAFNKDNFIEFCVRGILEFCYCRKCEKTI